MEDKQKILDKLCEAVQLTNAGHDLRRMEYSLVNGAETATLLFFDGYKKEININLDSGIGMMHDIIRRLDR